MLSICPDVIQEISLQGKILSIVKRYNSYCGDQHVLVISFSEVATSWNTNVVGSINFGWEVYVKSW